MRFSGITISLSFVFLLYPLGNFHGVIGKQAQVDPKKIKIKKNTFCHS